MVVLEIAVRRDSYHRLIILEHGQPGDMGLLRGYALCREVWRRHRGRGRDGQPKTGFLKLRPAEAG